ncbi:MAG: hypothetical protein H0W18_02680 [Acidobacteria bacterium]|nr:hypothetical protein [Acidobacteriota bacterium]
MYLRPDGKGDKVLWTVPDGVPGAAGRTTAPPPAPLMPSHEVRRRR